MRPVGGRPRGGEGPRRVTKNLATTRAPRRSGRTSISGLVVEYIVAIDVTRARFPADALYP